MKRKGDDVIVSDAEAGAVVKLSATFNTKKFRLFEVPEDILLEMQNGNVRLVGDTTGDAVLCTADKTYEIKKVETSNAVCMVPSIPLGAPASFCIESIMNDFFEVKSTAPRLSKLKDLLKESEYRGQSEETNVPSNSLLTRSELEQNVQASAAELQEALHELGAIDFNGYVRLISTEIIKNCKKELIDAILENGWTIAGVSRSKCQRCLPDMDPLLLGQVLEALGTPTGPESDTWVLDERRVAAASADLIMWRASKEGKRKFLEADFALEWEAQTPGTGARDASALEGIAVRDGSHLIYLPKSSLSAEATGRFIDLFSAKTRWTSSELQPYIADLFAKPGQPKTADELLLVHTRHVDGYYLSK